MAISEPHVSEAGRDCRAFESMVVQGYVAAEDTGGNGTAVGKAVRDTGGYKREQVTLDTIESLTTRFMYKVRR
jgi:hypothetical protein